MPDPDFPPIDVQSDHHVHVSLQRRLPRSYAIIEDAVAALPHYPLAEFRFKEYVVCYSRRAAVANAARSTLGVLAQTTEITTPAAIVTALAAIATPLALLVALGAASAVFLLAHHVTTAGHQSWKRRAGWLTAVAVVSSAIPLADLLAGEAVAEPRAWLVRLIGAARIAALDVPCTAVAVTATATLIALLFAHGFREMRCRVLSLLLIRRARVQLVCELVQSIDAFKQRELADLKNQDRHAGVAGELLSSVVHLHGRGRLVAALPLTKQGRRAATQKFRRRKGRIEQMRNDLLLPGCAHREEHLEELTRLAAGLLTEQDDLTEIVESRASRLVLGAQVTGVLLGVGAIAVATSLLAQAVGPTMGLIVTGLGSGLLMTVVKPVLTHLLKDADVSWLSKIIPSLKDGGDTKKKDDHEDKETA